MSKEIDELKSTARDYKTWALQARKRFIDLRLKQDLEIREIYIKLTKSIANEIKKGGVSPINKKRLLQIYSALKDVQDRLENQLTLNFEKNIKENVEAATGYSKAITISIVEKAGISKITTSDIKNIYFRVNERAVEAIWSRTQNGLYLSDRIWSKSQKYRGNMANIIQAAVAEGQDCAKTARALEQYVLKGKKTLASEYPNMMSRMGNRVPSNVSYEALRLARTEMTAAYGEATLSAAKISPSCSGVKYILSSSHPKPDVCDDITGTDRYGLGIGVYPLDEAPLYPFHPCCLCIVTTVNERPEDFVQRLKRWNADPASEPSIENWYQNVYKN